MNQSRGSPLTLKIDDPRIPRGDGALSIPPLIKRNTLLLAAFEVLSGAGRELTSSLGSLMVFELLKSASLSGVGLSLMGVSRLLIAYPVGRLTDTRGRKAGLFLALGLATAGAPS